MKILTLVTLLTLIQFLPALGRDPVLQPGVLIKEGSKPLKVSHYSAPTVADWNNDGKKDLIVGQFTSGRICLFLNQGSDINPEFNGSTFIESGGQPIEVSYG